MAEKLMSKLPVSLPDTPEMRHLPGSFRENQRQSCEGDGGGVENLLWSLWPRSIDELIGLARSRGEAFTVVGSASPVLRVFVGDAEVGVADPATTNFHRWPFIAEPRRPAHARMHDAADASDTFATCYFIGADTGPVKIGYSVDVAARMASMQAGSPVLLRILAIAPGGAAREAAYHQQFADLRLHGEWFRRTPEIEAEIALLQGADA